jgi:rhamnosyltransferase
MSKNFDKYISVFVPTYDGEQYLSELIEAVLDQQLPDGYALEFLITDSGSKDETLSILERYKDRVIVNKIPNQDFGHGRTRQRAAEKARGDFIVYLSQDATPSHNRWLINMIEPFFLSPKVGCVFGRQRPRTNAAVTIKREVSGVFNGLGSLDSIVISRANSLVDGREENTLNNFFSDVNSAVRRKLLVGNVPFRDLPYAEDQALAQDMQANGYLKAYAPKAEVWHSNEYTPKQYYHRKFDEFIGLQESVNLNLRPSLRSLLLGWLRPTWADWQFIRRDQEYQPSSKIIWALKAPLYNFAGKAGMYQALKYVGNHAVREKLSLEKRSKN